MTGTLTETIGALSRGVDELLPMLCKPVGDAELIDAQRQLQTLARKVYAAQLELDAVTEHAGLPQHHGYATARDAGRHAAPAPPGGGHPGRAPRAAGRSGAR